MLVVSAKLAEALGHFAEMKEEISHLKTINVFKVVGAPRLIRSSKGTKSCCASVQVLEIFAFKPYLVAKKRKI